MDLDELKGKPEKSFKRITNALTEKFPQPLGMLDDMLTQIEELMGKHHSRHASVLYHNLEWPSNALLHAESSKTSSKRKSSSSGTTAPKAKKPKQQRLALNEAATAMHAELRAMGFSWPADFGNLTSCS